MGGTYSVKRGFICFNETFYNMLLWLRGGNQERKRDSLERRETRSVMGKMTPPPSRIYTLESSAAVTLPLT